MSAAGRATWLAPGPLAPTGPSIAIGTLAVFGACAGAAAIVLTPESWRFVLALTLVLVLVVVAARWPTAAAVATLLFLPFLAFVRRLLIDDAGWAPQDPLLLVAPAVSAFILLRLMLAGRKLIEDRLSQLVLAMLAICLIQAFNPSGGSILAGLGGLLFVAAPLAWFFVGRLAATRRSAAGIVRGFVVVAVIVGTYGLWQTEIGFPAWDQAWLEVAGYTALDVGQGTIRGFGTFSSSAEYSLSLGVGLVFSFVLILHRGALQPIFKPVMIPVVAVLVTALFLASARGAVVLTLLAMLVLAGLRTRKAWLAIATVVVGAGASVVLLQAAAPALEGAAGASGDRLVTHQVGGLTNPLDPDRSTLLLHLELLGNGIESAIEQPLGYGTAATNIAAEKLAVPADERRATEFDLTDTFVAFGVVGGLLYLTIVVLVLRHTARRYMAQPDWLLLAVIGLLAATFGQWLIGGHYGLSPLTWFLIGWATQPRSGASSERGDG